MTLAKLTAKGQVTIPKKVREALKITTGDKIEILTNDQGEAIIRPVSKTIDEVFCTLQKPGQQAVSLEEINQAIQAKLTAKF